MTPAAIARTLLAALVASGASPGLVARVRLLVRDLERLEVRP